MKLKVIYRRRSGPATDVVVTTDAAATLADIARELVESDPLAAGSVSGANLTLAVAPPGGQAVRLQGSRVVGEAPIASGCEIQVVPDLAEGERTSVAAAVVRIIAGPDAGRQVGVPLGSTVIGRDGEADLIIDDPYVSKRHARIDVGSTIELVDLNSANGILVDGGVASRVTVLPGQEVQLGDTRLTISSLSASRPPTAAERSEIQGGAVPFVRSPRVEARFAETELPRPAVPVEPQPPMFPYIMLFAPVMMGIAMYVITDRAMSLLFIAMAPMMMVGNYVNTRKKNKRQLDNELSKFNAQLEALEAKLAASAPVEIQVRQAEIPDLATIYRNALERGPLLWTRRAEHWSFLHLRLGQAILPSRTTLAAPSDTDDGMPEHTARLAEIEERFRLVPDVPVLESAPLAGALGLVGTADVADVLRAQLVQLAGLHSPADLVIAALASPTEAQDLGWLRWLPHTSSAHSPLEGIHLADSQATVSQILAELEALAETRLGRRLDDPADGHGPLEEDLAATGTGGKIGVGDLPGPPPRPVVVLVITENAPIDRARLVQLCERAAEIGVVPIWVASDVQRLPSVCRTFLDVSGGRENGRANFVRHGVVVENVRVEGLTLDQADRFALALAPLFDSGAVVVDATDLPRNVSLVSLLGEEIAVASDAVIDRWRQNLAIHDRTGEPKPRPRPGTLRALVGQMGVDAMHLDLRAQGPHALVGGTTGAGKSEFLQSWVLGMASEFSPDRVSFLFVDYKGGAAFAECVRLPHCVGLVTDLSPHLVRRALTSLRAELRYREHLLNRKKAKDLLELEKRGDPEAPPALVIVVDEFAALVTEVPEFVDGVVDVAQRGRSLGIHLILATQRPAGVIKDNLRANTNLRIALRMADSSDSTDVIDTPVAAHFDPATPGRAIAKSGPGRLTTFQSAYVGGHTSAEPAPAQVLVHELRFGAEERWERPDPESEAPVGDLGPTDQVRLVESIITAATAAGVPAPRKPWLEELSPIYDLALLGPRTDSELILGVADLPDDQDQQTVYFKPDIDGNLAVYGTGGSGKSVLLRTLTVAAGVTPRGGPVHVYGLDFAAGGLRMLDQLPHVGAIVPGDDDERVTRLLRNLREIAEVRAREYPAVDAGSIEDFRRVTGRHDEPRILLLVDTLPAFREAYDVAGNRGKTYSILQQLLTEGRQLGIHVVFTADRPASVPGSIAASVPRRVVLRLADEASYMLLGIPNDVLTASSPPGRAVIDGMETQGAILGGSGNVADQSQAIGKLVRSMVRRGASEAPPVAALPTEIPLGELPLQVNGRPVLGISDETLEPIGFDPQGAFLLGGGPGSGRTNAFVAMAQSIRRWRPDAVLVYLGSRRSPLPDRLPWDVVAPTPEEIAEVAKQLTAAYASDDPLRPTAVFVESITEMTGTPADGPLVDLVRATKRSDNLLVGEADTATWSSMFPLVSEMRSARRGLLLQPEWVEGDAILKTTFPRSNRSEFPIGRGVASINGRAVRVQVPLAEPGSTPH